MHHKDNIQRCLGIMWMDEGDLLEYLKSAHINDLMGCAGLSWPVSLESPNAVRPFLTKTPKEIYTSDKPPVLDMMFVTASHVCIDVAKPPFDSNMRFIFIERTNIFEMATSPDEKKIVTR